MSFVALTTATELPKIEILIRNAIKSILKREPKIKNYGVKDIHNTKVSARGWSKPYIYVKFVRRTENVENTDIANFEYGYLFQIGVVAELKAMDEDEAEDYLLLLMNIVESALSVNKGLLGNTVLFHYAHDYERDDEGFLDGIKHAVLSVAYTQDVPLGS